MVPTSETVLDRLTAAHVPVVAIGKIEDLFAGRGITRAIHTASDAEGMDVIASEMASTPRGLIFANLVDFDTQYGHRNNVDGLCREPRAVRRAAARTCCRGCVKTI